MPDSREFDLSEFFDLSLDLLCIASTQGYFLKVNRAFVETLGYSKEELYSRPLLEFVHPDDRQATQDALDRLDEGQRVIDFQNRYQTKDEQYRWFEWRSNPKPKRHLVYAAARDVTQRRSLEKRLLNIHDETRRQVGQNLHDNLGQRLTGLYLIVDQFAKEAEEGDRIGTEQLSQLAREIKKTDQIVGRLAHRLVPVALEREGLEIALAQLAKETERLFGVSSESEISDSVSITDPTAATNLYHIAQEATTNCIKYSNASHVRISLSETESEVILKVEDDGEGLADKLDETQGRGLGLSIMKHRAKQLGGSLAIEANDDEGVTVKCSIPREACRADSA